MARLLEPSELIAVLDSRFAVASPVDVETALESIFGRLLVSFDLNTVPIGDAEFAAVSGVKALDNKRFPGLLARPHSIDVPEVDRQLVLDAASLLQIEFEHAGHLYGRVRKSRGVKHVTARIDIADLRDLFLSDIIACSDLVLQLSVIAANNEHAHHKSVSAILDRALAAGFLQSVLYISQWLRFTQFDASLLRKGSVVKSVASLPQPEKFMHMHVATFAEAAIEAQYRLQEAIFRLLDVKRSIIVDPRSTFLLLSDACCDQWQDFTDPQVTLADALENTNIEQLRELRNQTQHLQVLSMLSFMALDIMSSEACLYGLRNMHTYSAVCGLDRDVPHPLFPRMHDTWEHDWSTRMSETFNAWMEFHEYDIMLPGAQNSVESIAASCPVTVLMVAWSTLGELQRKRNREAPATPGPFRQSYAAMVPQAADVARISAFKSASLPGEAELMSHVNFLTAAHVLRLCATSYTSPQSKIAQRALGLASSKEVKAELDFDGQRREMERCMLTNYLAEGGPTDKLCTEALFQHALENQPGSDRDRNNQTVLSAFEPPSLADAPMVEPLTFGSAAAVSRASCIPRDIAEQLRNIATTDTDLSVMVRNLVRTFLRAVVLARCHDEPVFSDVWRPAHHDDELSDELHGAVHLFSLAFRADTVACEKFWNSTEADAEPLLSVLRAASSRFPLQINLLSNALTSVIVSPLTAEAALNWLQHSISQCSYVLPPRCEASGELLDQHLRLATQAVLQLDNRFAGDNLEERLKSDGVSCFLTRDVVFRADVEAHGCLTAHKGDNVQLLGFDCVAAAAREYSLLYSCNNDEFLKPSSITAAPQVQQRTTIRVATHANESLENMQNLVLGAASPHASCCLIVRQHITKHFDANVVLALEFLQGCDHLQLLAQQLAAFARCTQTDIALNDKLRAECQFQHRAVSLEASFRLLDRFCRHSDWLQRLPPSSLDLNSMVSATVSCLTALIATIIRDVNDSLVPCAYNCVVSALQLLLGICASNPSGLVSCLVLVRAGSPCSVMLPTVELHAAFAGTHSAMQRKFSDSRTENVLLNVLLHACGVLVNHVDPKFGRVSSTTFVFRLLGQLCRSFNFSSEDVTVERLLHLRADNGFISFADIQNSLAAYGIRASDQIVARMIQFADADSSVLAVSSVQAYINWLMAADPIGLTESEILLQQTSWTVAGFDGAVPNLFLVGVASLSAHFAESRFLGINSTCGWFAAAHCLSAFAAVVERRIAFIEPMIFSNLGATIVAHACNLSSFAACDTSGDGPLVDYQVCAELLDVERAACETVSRIALQLCVRMLSFDGMSESESFEQRLFEKPSSSEVHLYAAEAKTALLRSCHITACGKDIDAIQALFAQSAYPFDYPDREQFDSPELTRLRYMQGALQPRSSGLQPVLTLPIAQLSVMVISLGVRAFSDARDLLPASIRHVSPNDIVASMSGKEDKIAHSLLYLPRPSVSGKMRHWYTAAHLGCIVELASASLKHQRPLLNLLVNAVVGTRDFPCLLDMIEEAVTVAPVLFGTSSTSVILPSNSFGWADSRATSAKFVTACLSFVCQLWRSQHNDQMIATWVHLLRGKPSFWAAVFSLFNAGNAWFESQATLLMWRQDFSRSSHNHMLKDAARLLACQREVACMLELRSTAVELASLELMCNRQALLSEPSDATKHTASIFAEMQTLLRVTVDDLAKYNSVPSECSRQAFLALMSDCTALQPADFLAYKQCAQLVDNHCNVLACHRGRWLSAPWRFVSGSSSPAEERMAPILPYGRNFLTFTDRCSRLRINPVDVQMIFSLPGEHLSYTPEMRGVLFAALLNGSASTLHAQVRLLRGWTTLMATCPVTAARSTYVLSGSAVCSESMVRMALHVLSKLRALLQSDLGFARQTAALSAARELANTAVILLTRGMGISASAIERGWTVKELRWKLVSTFVEAAQAGAANAISSFVPSVDMILDFFDELNAIFSSLASQSAPTNDTLPLSLNVIVLALCRCQAMTLVVNLQQPGYNGSSNEASIAYAAFIGKSEDEKLALMVRLRSSLQVLLAHLDGVICLAFDCLAPVLLFTHEPRASTEEYLLEEHASLFYVSTSSFARISTLLDQVIGISPSAIQQGQATVWHSAVSVPSAVFDKVLSNCCTYFERSTLLVATQLQQHHRSWLAFLGKRIHCVGKEKLDLPSMDGRNTTSVASAALDELQCIKPQDAAVPPSAAARIKMLDQLAMSCVSIALAISQLSELTDGAVRVKNAGFVEALANCKLFHLMNTTLQERLRAGFEAYDLFPVGKGAASTDERSEIFAEDAEWMNPCAPINGMTDHGCRDADQVALQLEKLRVPPALAFAAIGYGFGPSGHRGYTASGERCLKHVIWCDTLRLSTQLHSALADTEESICLGIVDVFCLYQSALHSNFTYRRGYRASVGNSPAVSLPRTHQEPTRWTFGALQELEIASSFLSRVFNASSGVVAPMGTFGLWLSRLVAHDPAEAGFISRAKPMVLPVTRGLEYAIRDIACLLGNGDRTAVLAPSTTTSSQLRLPSSHSDLKYALSSTQAMESSTPRPRLDYQTATVWKDDQGRRLRTMAAQSRFRLSVEPVSAEERTLSVRKHALEALRKLARQARAISAFYVPSPAKRVTSSKPSLQADAGLTTQGAVNKPSAGHIVVPNACPITSTDDLTEARLLRTLQAVLSCAAALSDSFTQLAPYVANDAPQGIATHSYLAGTKRQLPTDEIKFAELLAFPDEGVQQATARVAEIKTQCWEQKLQLEITAQTAAAAVNKQMMVGVKLRTFKGAVEEAEQMEGILNLVPFANPKVCACVPPASEFLRNPLEHPPSGLHLLMAMSFCISRSEHLFKGLEVDALPADMLDDPKSDEREVELSAVKALRSAKVHFLVASLYPDSPVQPVTFCDLSAAGRAAFQLFATAGNSMVKSLRATPVHYFNFFEAMRNSIGDGGMLMKLKQKLSGPAEGLHSSGSVGRGAADARTQVTTMTTVAEKKGAEQSRKLVRLFESAQENDCVSNLRLVELVLGYFAIGLSVDSTRDWYRDVLRDSAQAPTSQKREVRRRRFSEEMGIHRSSSRSHSRSKSRI